MGLSPIKVIRRQRPPLLITVDRMEIEGLEAENIDVTCQDIAELAGVEGLLGLSFLRNFRTVIDYKSSFLEID